MDHDQHVAWTMEVAHQGVVPDRYEGTDAVVDYPLGLHALAVSTASALVSPAIVLNVLPLLTTLLVVGLVCGAIATLALDRAGPDTAAPLDLVLLEAGVRDRPEPGPVQRALLGVAALLRERTPGGGPVPPRARARVRRRAAATGDGVRRTRTPRDARSALVVAALIASGALAAALNPVLVPLQAVLCAVALAGRGAPAAGDVVRLGLGVAIGGALALAVVASDPYLSRRANLPGLRPPPAPYLATVQADFARGFTGRSCLTAACAGRALVSPAALAVAGEPLLALTQGAAELLFTPPAPLRYDRPAPGRHRFPDLTGVGLAPVHGRAAPYVFALLPWLFVAATIATRHRRLLAAAGCDRGGDRRRRGHPRRVPGAGRSGRSRAAPAPVLHRHRRGDAVHAGAVAAAAGRCRVHRRCSSTRGGAAGCASPRRPRSSCRWRRAPPDRWRAAWRGAASSTGPRAADLDALDRLEARVVPDGDAYLVAGRPPDSGGERWITPADDALLFYLYARRPTLFLYFLDHTARYGPAGLETTCAALQAGAGDTLLRTHRVRWALAAASADQAVQTVGRRGLCGRTLREWFPAMRAAGSDGRLTIVELWADPR